MGRRRTWLIVIAGIAVVALAIWALALRSPDGGPASPAETAPADASGPSTDDPAASTSADGEATTDDSDEVTEGPQVSALDATPRDDVAAGISPEDVSGGEGADEIVEPVVDVRSGALSAPDQVDWDAVVSVADGNLLADLEASVLEYTENGWTQEGVPAVDSSSVLEMEGDRTPPTAQVEVCLDYSDVQVLDANGDSLTDQSAPQRVLSTFALEFVDGRWVGVDQTFGDDTDC